MLGCNESNIIFQQHLCKLGQLRRSNGRNSQDKLAIASPELPKFAEMLLLYSVANPFMCTIYEYINIMRFVLYHHTTKWLHHCSPNQGRWVQRSLDIHTSPSPSQQAGGCHGNESPVVPVRPASVPQWSSYWTAVVGPLGCVVWVWQWVWSGKSRERELRGHVSCCCEVCAAVRCEEVEGEVCEGVMVG